MKRIFLSIISFFFAFIALYTWNNRTSSLDKVAAHTGLEITGFFLGSAESFADAVNAVWLNYIDLTQVRKENIELKEKIAELEHKNDKFNEDIEELKRLKRYFSVVVPEEWTKSVTKVLAGKLGAFSTLETIILDKGYLSGASVGRPLMTDRYIVGSVFQAGPSKSMALLINDPESRIAVISEKTRLHGILVGAGSGNPLEVHFIDQDVSLVPGEKLYTSGLDTLFPKGIPLAVVVDERPLTAASLHIYFAQALADFSSLEDLILLQPPLESSLRMKAIQAEIERKAKKAEEELLNQEKEKKNLSLKIEKHEELKARAEKV